MALSENQLRWIEEGIQLAVAAVLAAVRATGDQGEIDWSSVRITETPEVALQTAQRLKAFQSPSSEPATPASGPSAGIGPAVPNPRGTEKNNE